MLLLKKTNPISMKNLLFLIVLLFTTSLTFSQGIYVRGYYRSNGTYISGHYRTAPTEKYICTIVNNTQNTDLYFKKERDQTDTQNTTTGTTSTSTGNYSEPIDRTTNTSVYTAPVSTYSYISPKVYSGYLCGQYYNNSNGNKTYVSSY